MTRPPLTDREAMLLRELQIMKLWVVHKAEPTTQGAAQALKRDLASASKAISEATGGNEE